MNGPATSSPSPLSSPLSGLLARLKAEGLISAEQCSTLTSHAPSPWWLAALQALAAWLASLFMLAAFYMPVLMIGDSPMVRGVGGVLLAIVAIYLFRRDGVFVGQMALALSLAAQALMVSLFAGDFLDFDRDHRLIAAWGGLIAFGMMIPRSTSTHRTVCALVAMVFVIIATFDAAWVDVQASLLCAGAIGLWLSRRHWAGMAYGADLKAIANAASLLALPAAWLLPALGGSGHMIDPFFRNLAGTPSQTSYGVFSLSVGLLAVATLVFLTRALPPQTRLVALGGALALAVAAHIAPGLVFAVSLFAATFQACHRGWASVALVCTVLYLGLFYYDLQATLLVKAGALAASGLLLLALRQWLLHAARTDAPA